ncbi:MAG: CAP domain-containing protein [Patescibacteria group bacterium]|nr:CAP domain-containing protein [Patescibacteria group bacterium]
MNVKSKNKIRVGALCIAVLCSLLIVEYACASDPGIEKEIIDQANRERKRLGLQELQENNMLNKAAFLKAQDMIGNNYFSHTSPQSVNPWYWLDKVEYRYRYAGENLAMDFSSVASVHRAWMKSATHRENIVSERYKEIGVAVMKGIINGKETQVAVQFFGDPLNGNSIVAGSENNEKSSDGIKLQEVSVRPWAGTDESEMIVYAKLSGEPLNVEVQVGSRYFPLSQIQSHRYMSLISLEEINLNEDAIIVKAQSNEHEAFYFRVPKGAYAEYILNADQEENEKTLSAIASMKPASLIAKERVINSQNVILAGFMLACVVMIGNVWILEREEEKLFDVCHS